MTLRTAVRPCSLGLAGIVVGDQGVRVVVLGDDPDEVAAELAARLGGEAHVEAAPDDTDVAAAVAAVDGTGPLPQVDLRGTLFQLDVWAALQRVPAGRTVSYAELASDAGHPAATRAVGTACGANPVAVLVPCHRVLRADGSLGGYHWGTARKTALLAREGVRAG